MPGSKKAAKRGQDKAKASGRTKKKVRVMATGVFDILHTGHLFFLMEARKLGDELVVVVARDITAKKRKREPIVPEHLRLEMIRGLKPVDMAVLGDTQDYYRIVEVLKPDIIVLGYDQDHNATRIQEELSKRGLKVKVVRLPILKHDILATSRIIEKIAFMFPRDGVAESEQEWAEGEGVKGKRKGAKEE
jgi:FAD synthetase